MSRQEQTSWPITVERDGQESWSWFCNLHECGWSGMSCPSADFAEREGHRHVERDHAVWLAWFQQERARYLALQPADLVVKDVTA